jgi:NitT/TauT family transport system substrate-binding protein
MAGALDARQRVTDLIEIVPVPRREIAVWDNESEYSMVTLGIPVSSGSRLRRIMCTRPRRTSSNGIWLVSQMTTCGIGFLLRDITPQRPGSGLALRYNPGSGLALRYNTETIATRERDNRGRRMMTAMRAGRLKRLGVTLRHGAIALFVIALGSGPPAWGQAATPLAVAKVANDFALIMGDYGKKLGIFQREGVDPEISLITQARMIQATIAGSVDVALASGATLAFAAKGAPLKAVAALSGPLTILVLVVRPDNSIPAVEALRGRTAAVSNVGSLTDWAVSQLAISKGWDAGDIKRVAVGDTPARVAALRTGNVDAAVIDIAEALDLKKRGQVKILVNFGDFIKNFQNQIIYASDKAIAEKTDAVRRFVKGWFATIVYARGNKPETVAFARDTLGVRDSVATELYDQFMPSNFFSTDGVIAPATLAAMSESFVDLKLLPNEENLSRFVTNRFLPAKN